MQDSTITETQALDTLVKLSRTEIKRSKLDERLKNGVLNALERFRADFLPDGSGVAVYGEGDEVSRYEMAYHVVAASKNADLHVLWYVFYPYLVVSAPHIDGELYAMTKELLCTEENLGNVLSSRYSILVYDSAEDLTAAGLAGVYSEWYAPYTDYKNAPGKSGLKRETEKYQNLLAAGQYLAVVAGTERMLNYNPFDYNVILLNVSARVAALGGDGDETRSASLNSLTEYINSVMGDCPDDKSLTYLYYYRALCYLGLTSYDPAMLDSAKADFHTCLGITPDFELATFMLHAIEQKLE